MTPPPGYPEAHYSLGSFPAQPLITVGRHKIPQITPTIATKINGAFSATNFMLSPPTYESCLPTW